MDKIRPKPTPADAGRAVVEARGLSVGYDDKKVWHNASFSVRRGEFVAVIGPNGAGKTTMFRLLLGLQQPASGALTVFGSQPSRGNRRIGYVPQRHTIDNETNIECLELVHLVLSGNKWGLGLSWRSEKKTAIKALEAVGAVELAHKPLSNLSGGELQRIYLAEALVSDPEMLLLDEPLANLDIRRVKELVGVVHDVVSSRNVTTFLVAHDINPLIQFLDKVIYIANGKVATGRPEEVLTSRNLTALYGTPVEVLRDSRNNIVIVGAEEQGVDDHHEDDKNVI
jgi:zinc/manganese transport system ATP-binding protein